MIDFLVIVLMGIGVTAMGLAGVGLVRMPDIYTRMSATSKAATLGASALLLGAAVFFNDTVVTLKAIGIILFLFLTVPVASHRIGRAAYFDGVPLWKGTVINEMPPAPGTIPASPSLGAREQHPEPRS